MSTETILTTQEILHEYHGTDTDFDFARAIEQAVLQSSEVQAWKRDAERYRYLRGYKGGHKATGVLLKGILFNGLEPGTRVDEVMDAATNEGFPQSQDRVDVAALRKALQALEAISEEMSVGDRFTNAGQYLIDALEPVREAIDHARRVEEKK